MKATIGHIGINLSGSLKSFQFWKDLLHYFGVIFTEEQKYHFDAKSGKTYLCVTAVEKNYKKDGYHRKRIGLNHVAFRLPSPKQVDQFVSEFLEPRGIKSLYGGPRMYPEYTKGYYAVYFEDPERIKIEIVFEPT